MSELENVSVLGMCSYKALGYWNKLQDALSENHSNMHHVSRNMLLLGSASTQVLYTCTQHGKQFLISLRKCKLEKLLFWT